MKQGKNHVSWNENPPSSSSESPTEASEPADGTESDGIGSPPKINKTSTVTSNEEYEELKKKLELLKEEERNLDRYLEDLKEQGAMYNGQAHPTQEHLDSLPPGVQNASDNMYVRFKDITVMPEYRSETVIGIRAPTGTSLEVPDPDQGMQPGHRRFEMYLKSKGEQGADGKSSTEKGEPINVYLVQPRADQQKGGRGRQAGFVQQDTPPSQRGSSHRNPGMHEDANGPPPPGYGPPPSRVHSEPPYGMPPPHRGGEWGYGPGRPPYPKQDHMYRKDGPPPQGIPSHPDGPWGVPSPYGGYGHPGPRGSPGYYPHGPPRPGAHHSPESKLSSTSKDRHDREESRPDRGNEEGRYPPHGPGFAGNHEGSRAHGDRGNPFRPRPHTYSAPHEVGRTASAGAESSREASHGAFRPPSPSSQQQTLLNMPLQSPNDTNYLPSPSGGPGFSPPGNRRTAVRAGDVQFPMPTLPREGGREYRDSQWHPPHPKIYASSKLEEPPITHVKPRSRR